jgi:4-aminobutyrate aminotransferase/(S)-3-amino-2-methylpropionate transaminase
VRDLIKQWKEQKGSDVVAIIMEPIMAEGGDTQISGYFANQIRKLTKEMGIYMIIDEV